MSRSLATSEQLELDGGTDLRHHGDIQQLIKVLVPQQQRGFEGRYIGFFGHRRSPEMTKPAQRQPERVSGVNRKGCGLDVDDFQRQRRRFAFDDAVADEHGLAQRGFAASVMNPPPGNAITTRLASTSTTMPACSGGSGSNWRNCR
jgi:hypothetical protein